MKYAKVIKYDTGNWEGVNTTIFFSGCRFKCEGCFNAVAQDFNYGAEFTDETIKEIVDMANDTHVAGICVLGGEPFQQDLDMLYKFMEEIKEKVGKPVHLWSGYLYEDLLIDTKKRAILELADTLVDGQFVLGKKDLNLKFRGSSNQRVINLKESLKKGELVLIKS